MVRALTCIDLESLTANGANVSPSIRYHTAMIMNHAVSLGRANGASGGTVSGKNLVQMWLQASPVTFQKYPAGVPP